MLSPKQIGKAAPCVTTTSVEDDATNIYTRVWLIGHVFIPYVIPKNIIYYKRMYMETNTETDTNQFINCIAEAGSVQRVLLLLATFVCAR